MVIYYEKVGFFVLSNILFMFRGPKNSNFSADFNWLPVGYFREDNGSFFCGHDAQKKAQEREWIDDVLRRQRKTMQLLVSPRPASPHHKSRRRGCSQELLVGPQLELLWAPLLLGAFQQRPLDSQWLLFRSRGISIAHHTFSGIAIIADHLNLSLALSSYRPRRSCSYKACAFVSLHRNGIGVLRGTRKQD